MAETSINGDSPEAVAAVIREFHSIGKTTTKRQRSACRWPTEAGL
jgi:hypothetical protein